MQNLEQEQPGKQYKTFFWLIVYGVTAPVSFIFLVYGGESHKQWAGMIALSSVGSLIVFRTLQECASAQIAEAFAPYVSAVLLIAVVLGVFVPGILSTVGLSVFAFIVCIAGICWLVRGLMNVAKDISVRIFKQGKHA